jgi:hypothetical protein
MKVYQDEKKRQAGINPFPIGIDWEELFCKMQKSRLVLEEWSCLFMSSTAKNAT